MPACMYERHWIESINVSKGRGQAAHLQHGPSNAGAWGGLRHGAALIGTAGPCAAAQHVEGEPCLKGHRNVSYGRLEVRAGPTEERSGRSVLVLRSCWQTEASVRVLQGC